MSKWDVCNLHNSTLRGEHQICSFFVGGQALDSFSLKDAPGADDELVGRSGGVGPGSRRASLWWTSTWADERVDDIKIRTETGLHKLPFSSLYTFNQAGRTQDSLNKWRDVKIYRSKDVPWR